MSEMNETATQYDLKLNDIWRLRPKDYSELANWCRENMFLIVKTKNGEKRFLDTYWGIGGDGKNYSLNEILKLGEISLYCNLDNLKRVSKDEQQNYEESARYYISEQHGCTTHYFVRKDAGVSLSTMIQNARKALNEAEKEAEYAVRQVAWQAQELQKLLDREEQMAQSKEAK